MLRALHAWLIAIPGASAANAATLTVVSNKLTYLVGETITLTVMGDDAGATTYGIFGKLVYDGALVNNATRTQTALTGPTGKWTRGPLNGNDTGTAGSYSWAFSQVTPYAQGADQLPGVLSTVTLIAQAAGLVNVNWDTTNSNPFLRLDFFGLTSAPGTTFCVGCEVPEPGTTALVGVGLLALVAARRHNGVQPCES